MSTSPASDYCQRWRNRHHSFHHRSEGGFNHRHYDVAAIGEASAKAFVITNHYSGSYPASRFRYGLWDWRGELQGVAVLSVPVRRDVLTGPFPNLEPYQESLELGRFVLADAVPANGESWFLAQAFRLAAQDGVRGVVSFADPLPRRTADGRLIFPGHIGTIYQASNAFYAGRGAARQVMLLPDGRVLNARALSKVRSLDRGHEYVEETLRQYGASPRRGQDPHIWLPLALTQAGVRRVKHPGNHRYLFRLGDRRARLNVVLGFAKGAYPKLDEVVA